MVVSTFIEILNKKQKNVIIWYLYKLSKHDVSDFTNNFITLLLDKLSNENKNIMIMSDFNINLINYYDTKILVANFLGTMFPQSFFSLFLLTSEGWKAESTFEQPSGFEHGTPGLRIQCPNH